MKQLLFIKFCIIAICLINSCKNKETVSNGRVNSFLKIDDSLKINIPDSISIWNTGSSSVEWNYHQSQLIFLKDNQNNNQACFYKYDFLKKHWESLCLDFEGPNQVYSTGPFKFSEEYIFYFPSVIPKIIVLNKNGQIIIDYDMSKDWSTSFHNSLYSNNISFDGEKIALDIGHYTSLDNPEKYSSEKNVGIFNIKQKKFKEIINYPNEFKESVWSSNQVLRNSVLVNDTIYLNYSKSPYIYQYDLEGNFLNKKEISFPQVKKMKGSFGGDTVYEALKYEEHGYYPQLIYDEENKLFYRICNFIAGNKKINNIEDLKNSLDSRMLGILTFNHELEIISRDTFNFKETGMVTDIIFAHDQGLFIKTVNNQKKSSLKFLKLNLKYK